MLRKLFQAIRNFIAWITGYISPPTPEPEPEPDDKPEPRPKPLPPSSGVRVIIVEETADRHRYPNAMKIATSGMLRAECDRAGVALHFVDKDAVDELPDEFAAMVRQSPHPLPYVILAHVYGVHVFAVLPSGPAALLNLIGEFIKEVAA